VENTRTGEIVSSLNLISQTWAYEGIPFKVGRPELVGTLPEYRNRGLVRAQFDVIHRWSAERGELVQAITGIPYYYRLFGYEMAMDLGGGKIGYKWGVPVLPEGKQEPYNIRPAAEADIPFLARVYNASQARMTVSCLWDEELWRYEISGKSPRNVNRYEVRIIETVANGQPVGYIMHPFQAWWDTTMVAVQYELDSGVPWTEVTPSVVRYLYSTGEKYAEAEGKKDKFSGFGFFMGPEHPVYNLLSLSLVQERKSYAWYLRVPDMPDFLRLIAPALENRLAASPLAGMSREVKVTFYKSGVRIVLEKGRITTVESWKPVAVGHEGDIAFPGLTFLQLLFGYRTFDEVHHAFPDCFSWQEDVIALVNVLFPRRPACVIPVS
jgi:hypothetical protein